MDKKTPCYLMNQDEKRQYWRDNYKSRRQFQIEIGYIKPRVAKGPDLITCECGSVMKKSSMSGHLTTKKHFKYVKQTTGNDFFTIGKVTYKNKTPQYIESQTENGLKE